MAVVGVLSLQGAVSEHLDMVSAAGRRVKAVACPADLRAVDALIIPGGESTAISRLIDARGLRQPLKDFANSNPVLGTCAGMVLCAASVDGSGGRTLHGDDYASRCMQPEPLGLMDIQVRRNGFGRQADSFEYPLQVADIGTVPAVFIRAPYIAAWGPEVRVMAEIDGKAVMARTGNVLVTSFHPELTEDAGIIRYFLGLIP